MSIDRERCCTGGRGRSIPNPDVEDWRVNVELDGRLLPLELNDLVSAR